MPQVHGAIRTALSHARQVVEIESGSATDNPLVFSETAKCCRAETFTARRSHSFLTTPQLL
jgi:histidine ammonia-lyase